MEKCFVAIIWGYPASQFKHYTLEENYHLQPVRLAKAHGYKTIIFGDSSVLSIANDPNFEQGTEIVCHTGLWAYLCFLWSHRSDLVYVNTYLWRSFVVPFVCRRSVFMGHHTPDRRTKLKQVIQDFVFKFFWRIRAVTEGEKEFLISRGLTQEKIFVVPLTVNTQDFRLLPGHTRQGLVYMGNITMKKNLKTILKALAVVKQQVPGVSLDVIGSISDDPFWPTVDSLGLRGNLNMLGFVPHNKLPELLNNYKIYVNSSLKEGQCLAVYESALCGLALCLPNILAFNPTFKNLALFHNVYDSNKLAENILTYLGNDGLTRELNGRCQKFVLENCSGKVIEHKLINLFQLTT